MIYMTTNDGQMKLIILETGNLEELKKGRPATTPDRTVCIGWTPDAGWLAEQIAKTDGNTEDICRLIEEATKRPERMRTEPFPTISKTFHHQ